MANETMFDSEYTKIQIHVKDEDVVDFTYIAIVLIILVGLVILYGVISCIRFCCADDSAPQIHTEFQSQDWLSRAPERYNKILSESPESVYDTINNKYEQTNCSICLGEFEKNCSIRKLVCSHIFHKNCIEAWIRTKIALIPRCPMCNVELTHERPAGFVEDHRNQPNAPPPPANVNPAPAASNNQNAPPRIISIPRGGSPQPRNANQSPAGTGASPRVTQVIVNSNESQLISDRALNN